MRACNKLSARAAVGSLDKLYLTLSLPPSSPERRVQSWCDELIVIVTYIVEAVFVAKLFILL